MNIKLQERVLLIKKISLTKFKEGGAAILDEQNKNHHKDIEG